MLLGRQAVCIVAAAVMVSSDCEDNPFPSIDELQRDRHVVPGASASERICYANYFGEYLRAVRDCVLNAPNPCKCEQKAWDQYMSKIEGGCPPITDG